MNQEAFWMRYTSSSKKNLQLSTIFILRELFTSHFNEDSDFFVCKFLLFIVWR